MYNTQYHFIELKNYSFLVTGGAGFIGSNLVEYLLKNSAGHVRVLDNLSNGYRSNIKKFFGHNNFEFVEGDIRNIETCYKAVNGVDFISHQAALGSVPRSINDPKTTNEVNITGFLNVLMAAKDSKTLKKMVYAASSSTYGDSVELPKVEGKEGNTLSPYAVTKLVNELYADVFSKVYGFHTIGLRYFNVFGPNQNPNNPYSAVIPIFCKNFIDSTKILINGDGSTSRDFTFVENAVQANIKAMLVDEEGNKQVLKKHEVFNIACGQRTTLNEVVQLLTKMTGIKINVEYKKERIGDVRHSIANINKAKTYLGYQPLFFLPDGLKITFDWYKDNINKMES